MQPVLKSVKLANVCYDIRGPVMARSRQMEEEGHRIIKLNIGNPAAFGFEAPDEIVRDVIHNLPNASGYVESKGLFAARKAVMHYTQAKRIAGRAGGRHLHRQWGLRADRDDHAGPARQRRRGPGADPGLSPVDGRRHPRRRYALPLPVRRGGRLAARIWTTSAPR